MENSTDGDPRQHAGEHLRADFAPAAPEAEDPLDKLQRDWGRQEIYDAQVSTLDVDLDRQRAGKERFAATVANAEHRGHDAIEAALALALDPGNPDLKRRLLFAQAQATVARERVERGRQTYEANARRWYGGTRGELREAEREAYAAKIANEEGRAVRGYKRPAGMSPEDRAAHTRQKQRDKKAAYRARKAVSK